MGVITPNISSGKFLITSIGVLLKGGGTYTGAGYKVRVTVIFKKKILLR
jgi:hypothetical protein